MYHKARFVNDRKRGRLPLGIPDPRDLLANPIETLENVILRANFFAAQNGRALAFDDAEKAIAESNTASSVSSRGATAMVSQDIREPAAAQSSISDFIEEPFARCPELVSPMPTWPGMFSGSRDAK
jgi:hypothetical protein